VTTPTTVGTLASSMNNQGTRMTFGQATRTSQIERLGTISRALARRLWLFGPTIWQ
jgi:hypothetical protein